MYQSRKIPLETFPLSLSDLKTSLRQLCLEQKQVPKGIKAEVVTDLMTETDGASSTSSTRKPVPEAYRMALLRASNRLKDRINVLCESSEASTISHTSVVEAVVHAFEGDSLDCQTAYLVIAHFSILTRTLKQVATIKSKASQKISENLQAKTQVLQDKLPTSGSKIIELHKEVDRQKKIAEYATNKRVLAEQLRLCAEAGLKLSELENEALKTELNHRQAAHEKCHNDAILAAQKLKESGGVLVLDYQKLKGKSDKDDIIIKT
jgi:phage-related minor tail protein